ncbi:hypothetical protein N480_09290 [Pseudoalteromonas luteoviolacea S2607]|uniref:hypothetical protein n=1 Tax=Pseudoalteromonas luteoviolacea TaxID=43657 RepID=UPI0007B16A18|nr:hypothetical protein [Pseudoalteromonas luteoviolacea]KZN28951.1 hypothetical protein N480_09290 [Pseudoalteromonas luteoviolacea S2607]
MKLKIKAKALKTLSADQQRLPNQLTRQIAAGKYPVTTSTCGTDACKWLTC